MDTLDPVIGRIDLAKVGRDARELVKDHLPLFIAAATFALFLFRILAAAHFDVNVAPTLLRSSDTVKVLLAFVLTYLTLTFPVLLLVTMTAIGFVLGRRRRSAPLWIYAALFLTASVVSASALAVV